MSLEERCAAIRACGVGEVTALDFTRELAALEPEAFAARHLARRRIRCGANWRFGKGGRGDAELLRSCGAEVTVVPTVEYGGAPVSSTRIRAALEAGRPEAACGMLGRPFRVRGVRFAGKGEGRRLACPTLNLRLQGLSLRLPLGVYVAEVDGAQCLANYGVAPTFGPRAWPEPVMEVHFPQASPASLAGCDVVSVGLLRFVRPERAFATLDALKAQIAADLLSVGRGPHGEGAAT